MELTVRLAAMVAVFGLAAWGWGRAFRYWLDRRVLRVHSLTALLGLAAMNAVGGLLNLFHLATPPVLLAMLAGGLLVAVAELRRLQPRRWPRRDLRLAPVLLALVLTFTVCHLLAPGGVFNIHDDFHTYATRAVRMAQTGFVGGNPFDPLGLDSLGSQSFFHAFFLAGHDIGMLNGFDAVACFGLGLLLVAELSRHWRLPWWIGVTAVLALAAINPQYVNVSPLYSGAAAILALVTCGAWWARSLARGHALHSRRAGVAVALLAAWLVTLKITLAAFCAVYLGGLLVLLLAQAPHRARLAGAAARTAFLATLFVLPWLLLPLSTLLQARTAAAEPGLAAPLAAEHAAITERNVAALLQPGRLWYGNSTVLFLALALAGAGLAAISLSRLWKRCDAPRAAALASVAAAGAALTPLLLLQAHLFPIASAVRYSCPILIGAFLAVALGFLRFSSAQASRDRIRFCAALAVTFSLFIAAFASSALQRLQRASRDHTLLAYGLNRHFTAYSRATASPAETAYAARLQEHLPLGATALVWTVAPFHLDFARNRLLTLSESGVSNPALRFPAGADIDSFARYLGHLGVQYVVFETNAYGIKELDELAALSRSRHPVERKLGDYGAYLRTTLTTLAARHPATFSDDRMVIFELAAPAPSQLTLHPRDP